MLEALLNYWPLLSSFVGMLIGGAVTWATARVRLEQLFTDMRNLEQRVTKNEERTRADDELRNSRHMEVISRLSSIEATLSYIKTITAKE